MRKYQKLYQLKQLIKADSEVSKYYRLTRKLSYPDIYDKKLEDAKKIYYELKDGTTSLDSRLLHIAYSLLRGKKYFQVERSVRQGNQLSDWEWKAIVKIMEFYKDEENTNEIPQIPFPITQVNEPKKKVEEIVQKD